jgi:2-polyprenyl-6-methoxyphenol hydroxylase-like FAD-dependent oxidoreductase
MTEIDVPVLIVGAGPVGLLGAQLLGRQGIRTLIAEKYPSRLEAPKAHALNPRSLEICAAAGVDMAALHAVATPTDEGRYVRMVETLSKPDIGVLAYERQDEAVRQVTPWPLINIEQPRFEEVLERAVLALPSVDLRKGLEWLSCDQGEDGVVSTLKDRASGEEIKVRSRYLIAADGAGSPVRDSIGIPMEGPEGLAHNMMIHFEADLRGLVGDRPAILYFLFGPGPNGVMIAYDIGKTWVMMNPCNPEDRPEDLDDEACRKVVLAAVGADVPDLTIKGVRSWIMSAQVARRYRSGNVFLVGDAGHRFPPTGGLGLNTGIGDIDNLAWKIVANEAGWAGPALLDSYDTERRNIADTNMGQSVVNAMRIRMLFEALGYGYGQSVDADTFYARLSDPESRAKVDEAVAFQKDHFDSLRLQMGFAYGDGLKSDDMLPVSQFEQKVAVGARLPHMALTGGGSTLDLTTPDGFVLITGRQHGLWTALAEAAAAPVRVVAEGTGFETLAGDWASAMGLTASGALLVRPDGHLLAVAATDLEADRVADVLIACLAPALEGAN